MIKYVKNRLQEEEFCFSKIHQQLMLNIEKYNHKKEKELQTLGQRLHNGVLQYLSKKNTEIHIYKQSIHNYTTQYLLKQQNILHQAQTKVELLHPENILKRGYSITMKNGKAISCADEVAIGELLVTKLFQGEIKSEVK
jgi:exodeoxyribonuclease VII large subunit